MYNTNEGADRHTLTTNSATILDFCAALTLGGAGVVTGVETAETETHSMTTCDVRKV